MEITYEKDIAERIINLINELHPVKTPRIDLDMPSFKSPSMDILINLIEEDKQKGKENLEKCKDMIKEENIIEAINAQKFSSNKEYIILKFTKL